MKLLVVRHGQSRGNATADYSTAQHDSLSPRGQEQAQALAVHLEPYTFDRLVVSPLQRALETMAPSLRSRGGKAEVWPELAEACWQETREGASHSWGTEPASIPEHLDGLFEFRNGRYVKPSEHESYGQGLRRVHDAVALLRQMADSTARSVLMVTHGYVIREMFNIILAPDTRQDYSHDNCGMSLLVHDDGWRLEYLNRPATEGCRQRHGGSTTSTPP
jgi:broad specificity phosphatase PhoE